MIPDEQDRGLGQPDRPGRVAGFVSPGSEVALFLTGPHRRTTGRGHSRILLARVKVLGIGDTSTMTSITTTTEGESTTEKCR